MKRMVSTALALLLIIGTFSPSLAQERVEYKKAPSSLTIQEVKKQAREFIRGEEYYKDKQVELEKLKADYEKRYGKRFVSLDKVGNEKVTYFKVDDLPTDPVRDLEKLSEVLEEIRLANEDAAEVAFFNLLLQENKLTIAKNARELSEFGKMVSEVSHELGKIVSVDVKNAQIVKKGAILNVKQEELALDKAYEELNKLLGYSPNARYETIDESIISKAGQGIEAVYLPSNMNAEDYARLKSLNEQKKELDRKAQAQRNLDKSHERGKEKEDIEELINLKELQEDYEKTREDVTRSLQKGYIDSVSSFLDLEQARRNFEQQKKSYENEILRYKLGKVSKLDYLKKEAEYFANEKSYLETVYSLYQQVEEYKKLYREKK
ncbi:MAG: TolC family protein [Filifactor alocis]|nr:TolC family protein [Filifactor alocis]